MDRFPRTRTTGQPDDHALELRTERKPEVLTLVARGLWNEDIILLFEAESAAWPIAQSNHKAKLGKKYRCGGEAWTGAWFCY